jgi:aspartyl-tRNA(Asn)/glutamyl-tRNA(Gln) amidotransferase subunit C
LSAKVLLAAANGNRLKGWQWRVNSNGQTHFNQLGFAAGFFNHVKDMSDIDIEHLSALAALELSAEEKVLAAGDLAHIIGMIDRMQSTITDGVPPMANPLDMKQRLRADVITEQVDREHLQSTTSHVHNGYYVVPRVME